ncbi:MAG: succinate dehydrogenase, cytochrome b556 subunit [Cellvibrionales bacterium]|nr:succinate dehydrogenase, cytochrome b556 subunit [Cellvibrionales bacterium]MBT7437413.1 succinate dehydrogenase, cytochrome b556 subunit [Cellvibrionales bacterium]MCH9798262.1 succinate dehydrogenase, cytochrome b556 subunit [Gammaproteobacteria bacterium]MCH9842861.1 succinate dehydrogenase, cytochrome b556 subunit [Gammaproteobacteria bacterium]MDA7737320.1 succinate dehydrogenase, cytochrome b556 subunit [Porticoccus sp.]
MSKKRPVNLDIGTIHLPVTAYVSILHRVSGVVLFGAVGLFLWILDSSLSSEESFNSIKVFMSTLTVQIIIWLSLAALIYHLVAGLRHLVMDYGYGETLSGGILGAKLVLVLSVILMLMAGFWLWI